MKVLAEEKMEKIAGGLMSRWNDYPKPEQEGGASYSW